MEKLLEYVNTVKYQFYLEPVRQLINLLLVFVDENDILLYRSIMMNNIRHVYLYSGNSISDTRNLLNYVRENWNQTGLQIFIYAKRINENTILIRFDKLNLIVIIYHLFVNFDTIGEFMLKEENHVAILGFHSLMHMLSFPDISIVSEEELILLSEHLVERELRRRTNYNIQIKSQYINDLIIIGYHGFKINGYDLIGIKRYLELIYTRPVNERFIKFVRDYARQNHCTYKFNNGDYDLRKKWVDFTKNGVLICRIYDGAELCVPFFTIRNQYKVGKYFVCLKYLLLDIIYDDRIGYEEFLEVLSYLNLSTCFINNDCHLNREEDYASYSISSYERYYRRNWGKIPWNYKILLK